VNFSSNHSEESEMASRIELAYCTA
jgi:hypothetical protein